MSRVRDGEGTHNPGLPLHWLFLLSPAETIHPMGRDNPLGTCDFHLQFWSFPDWGGRRPAASERGQGVGRPARARLFLAPVSEQVGEARTDGPEHEAESR